MGASLSEGSDWGIVGGTGEFSMARGVIKRKLHEVLNGGEIQELTIHGFCAKKVMIECTDLYAYLFHCGTETVGADQNLLYTSS